MDTSVEVFKAIFPEGIFEFFEITEVDRNENSTSITLK